SKQIRYGTGISSRRVHFFHFVYFFFYGLITGGHSKYQEKGKIELVHFILFISSSKSIFTLLLQFRKPISENTFFPVASKTMVVGKPLIFIASIFSILR